MKTIEDTNAQLLRNTAQCALRNFGTWWMDLGATGWFDDPRMWAEMARLKALDEPLLQNPRPFRPEVAAVIDERSMLRVAAGGHVVTVPGVYEVRRPLGRMGAPYGQYLLDDVLAGKVPAKLYVLLTAWCLSPEQRRQLLRADPRQLAGLVLCARATTRNDGMSLDAMRELTGFRLRAGRAGQGLGRTDRRGPAAGSDRGLRAWASASSRCLPPPTRRRRKRWPPTPTAPPRSPCDARPTARRCSSARPG